MLTVTQVAQQLNVCRALVYGWISSGRLAHFRLGGGGRRGAIRIAEEDLRVFLQRR